MARRRRTGGFHRLPIMQALFEGLGRKTNRGFYDYTVTPPRPTR
jgi:hypothetical protein